MPVTGPSSYISVVPAFLNHWADANALGAAIVLDGVPLGQLGDQGIAFLQTLQTELLAARDALEATNLDVALSAAALLAHKTFLNAQCAAFNKVVRADHSTTTFVQALPEVPQFGDAREKFNRPLRQMLNLWAKVNAYRTSLTPSKSPIVLPGLVSVTTVTTRLAALVTEQNTFEEREQQAVLDRLKRENVQDRIYPVLRIYRQKIEASFAPSAPIVLSLPALTDSGSGTPAPGGITGALNPAGTEAVLTGTASPSPTVVAHQLRASVGEEPNADDETMRAEFPLGQAIALSSDYGLSVPGAKVHWRLVAITADGHESGTPWLSFQRPL